MPYIDRQGWVDPYPSPNYYPVCMLLPTLCINCGVLIHCDDPAYWHVGNVAHPAGLVCCDCQYVDVENK